MFPYLFVMLGTLLAGVLATLPFGKRASRGIAIAATLAVLIMVALMLITALEYGAAFSGSLPYISAFGISFSLQAGAVQLMLITMASIVAFAAVIGGNVEAENVKASNALVMLFELSAIGLFASANFFLFYIFWDIGVIAGFFMIYSLGGAMKRVAANAYLVYSIFASAMLLLGILLIYFYTPVHTFSISGIEAAAGSIPVALQELIFLPMFIAFIVKMPVFPLHSWMPNAYAEASTQGSMLLSGVLSKFGAYGMLVLFSMLPIASKVSGYVFALASISAFYAAFAAMHQSDIKRMVGYTSMLEGSIILAGISALNYFGTYGSAYLMLAHGLAVALLFLAAGSVQKLFGDTDMRSLRGIAKNAGPTAYTFLLGIFATTGMPLTATFIADVLIFIGAITAFGVLGIVPLLSIILVGAYMYYAVRRSFLSTATFTPSRWRIGASQNVAYAVLFSSIFIFGIVPVLLQLVKV
ncbi:NADH-quinone oxidoreductase subunit M [Candidatus Marsarchaeota archaeon]|jgi:NADH-quinone oxidoreductase subunit M|nr:NADH-quinone oxidoreductase subunit M [Candidatus Marsarchaeota archaeon]MCL5100062.1 NADH-quinone oxidoreductase subunit M [Candidatus Marsarchaeota archaeon]